MTIVAIFKKVYENNGPLFTIILNGGNGLRKYTNNIGMQMILIAVVTAVAGEFKITPFSGDLFRIGLGSSAFLLLLVLLRHLPYVYTGIVTGVTVLAFRSVIDGFVSFETFSLIASMKTHLSASLYYIIFAVGMKQIQPYLPKLHPLLLAGVFSGIDFISNELELLTRSLIFDLPSFYSGQWLLLGATSVVRSLFVVGIFSSMMINQMRVVHNEQKKRMDQMLNFGSGLYGEVFYLKKSMDAIERITSQSYDLYGKLSDAGDKNISRSMLDITQQIHEVKKDSQRILSGLLKLFDRESASDMTLSEIIIFVIESNEHYSRMLKKEVHYEKRIGTDYATAHYIPLLTMLNNLVSNAVEAIDTSGTVRISVYEQANETVLVVSDTGEGIAEQNKDIIFEPGFTTKFNMEGCAATGIGLSHVRDIVRSTGGRLRLQASSPYKETTFVVAFSTDTLKIGV
ncbi:ATP-binding protein [Paenibacillus sp. FJAT-27812]|uniref:ATP-binding protein n=1 Tax=Paenibacillus sp. FJAT-27812 TaxID=1684143 RepID=UPI000A6E4C36|nr:ATP-binding protein [Paenibacillus sp. FJAT-27812]